MVLKKIIFSLTCFMGKIVISLLCTPKGSEVP